MWIIRMQFTENVKNLYLYSGLYIQCFKNVYSILNLSRNTLDVLRTFLLK